MDAQEVLRRSQLAPGRRTWWSRVPFALAGLGGGALLILLKLSGIGQVWVTITAMALIVLYAAAVQFVALLRIREDQLADNCYYLGFLYTLVSLAYALWDFSRTGSEETIVGNFGLALGSTIVGVFMRVTINQARKDVLETEVDARMELANSVIRLRVQIDDAVLALDRFHKQTEQIASDAIRAAADRAGTALDECIAKVGVSSSGVMDKIDQAFREFTESAQQLNLASSGTVKGLKTLLTRIEKIEAPNDIVLRRLEPALTAVAMVTDRLRERIEADTRNLAEAEERARKIGERVSSIVTGFSGMHTDLERASEQIIATSRNAENTNSQFQKLARQIAEAIELQAQLASATRVHGEKINENSQAQFEATMEAFQAFNNGMELELNRCRRMVAATGDALADLADSLGDRLEVIPSNTLPVSMVE